MSTLATLTLRVGMVACGDVVKGTLRGATQGSPRIRVCLVCRLASEVPREVEMASYEVVTSPDTSVPFRLAVPTEGPITARGSSLAVSWAVTAVDPHGAVLAEVPLVVAPRGGVALWLQRHAAPPG